MRRKSHGGAGRPGPEDPGRIRPVGASGLKEAAALYARIAILLGVVALAVFRVLVRLARWPGP